MIEISFDPRLFVFRVQLDTDDPNTKTKPNYRGDVDIVRVVRNRLSLSYGAFGHILDPDNIDAIDLHHALVTQFGYLKPVVTEGADKLKTYKTGIPSGAVT